MDAGGWGAGRGVLFERPSTVANGHPQQLPAGDGKAGKRSRNDPGQAQPQVQAPLTGLEFHFQRVEGPAALETLEFIPGPPEPRSRVRARLRRTAHRVEDANSARLFEPSANAVPGSCRPPAP